MTKEQPREAANRARKNRVLALVCVASLLGFLLKILVAGAAPLGTAFTYQGQLQDSGAVANGTYDFQCALYDSPTNGNQVGSNLTNSAVAVTNGLFILSLDFGGVFSTNALWLSIGVRTNGSPGNFASLTPLQALTPVPFALAGPPGTSASFSSNTTLVSNLTVVGSLTAASISGDGQAVTNLNASNINAGVVSVTNGGTGAATRTGAAANFAILDMNLQTGLTAFAAMSNATPAFPGQLGISYYGVPVDNEYMWQARTAAKGDWNFLFGVTAGNLTLGDQTHMRHTAGQGDFLMWIDGNTNYSSDATVNDSAFVVASAAIKSSGSAIGPAMVGSDGAGGVQILDWFPIQMVAVSPDCIDSNLWPGQAYIVEDPGYNFYVGQPMYLGATNALGQQISPNYVGMAEEYGNEFYLPIPTANEINPHTIVTKAFRVIQNPDSPNLGSVQVRSNLFLRGTIYAGGTTDLQKTYPLTTASGQLNGAAIDPNTSVTAQAMSVNTLSVSGSVVAANSSNQFSGNFTGNGNGMTNLNANNLTGIVSPSNLDGGLANNATFLRGNSTYAGLSNSDFPTWLVPEIGGLIISSNGTAAVPIQIYTNAASASGVGNTMIQMGTPAEPDMASVYLSTAHGGIGNGSELNLTANRIAVINPKANSGGVVQVNGSGLLGLWAILMHYQGSVSSGNLTALSGALIQYSHASWNGAEAVGGGMDIFLSRVDTNGNNGTLTVYDSYPYPNDANDNPVALGVTHRQDIMSGLGVKNYGAHIVDQADVASPDAGATIDLNLGMAWQDINMAGALTLNLTNLAAITNTISGTHSAAITDVYYYPGAADRPLTHSFPASINLRWESETGIAVAPTVVTNGMILHVKYSVAVVNGATNCFARASWAAY